MFVVIFSLMAMAAAGPTTENYKDQYCTDPRTMQKHLAYTEWADAYSCTRHRCQPGGRNLAIYTVGCKRVEAPESAIECEEVVEDTNMQFPYCCTRLRCLVVVRGEVWTRVLGQPWETLPAAPWSHMYKMKKPPPGENAFLPKNPSSGPVYELASDAEGGRDKVLRASKKGDAATPDCNEVAPRSVPTPDIVIALSTTTDVKDTKKSEPTPRHKRVRKPPTNGPLYEEDPPQEHHNEVENDDTMPTEKELKPLDAMSEEKYFSNAYGVTQKPYNKNQHHQVSWTEVPPTQWNEREHDTPTFDADTIPRDGNHPSEFPPLEEKSTLKEEKPTNLQALVDAIGTRMRDIENVVQRMSEKVHHAKTTTPDYMSGEKGGITDGDMPGRKRPKEMKEHAKDRTKRPNPDGDTYKRFSVRNRGSKYLHTGTDTTTDQPLFIEDNNMNGYFSDASNSVMRRSNTPKLREPRQNATSGERVAPEVLEEREDRQDMHIAHANCNHTSSNIEPQLTYMAPVDARRKTTHIMQSDVSEEGEKKKKKHSHKKKKGKGRSHKKHHKEEKKKKAPKTNSAEVERNVVSLEDSSALTNN